MEVGALVLLTWAFGGIGGYNLDVGHPLFFRGQNESGRRGDYFGLSVSIRPNAGDLNDSWFVQVGAPRGNARGGGLPGGGSVYRCRWNGPCSPVLLGESLGRVGGEGVLAFSEKEGEAWIGCSMDMRRFGGIERSIVCGHRWMNEKLKNSENIDITYLMTGACYLQDLYNGTWESNVVRLLPLVNAEKIYAPKPYIPNLSTYHWGLGQAGASVLVTDNFGEFIIGAPGVSHWIGSVIRYDSNLSAVVGDFGQSDFPKSKRYTYLGYAIASGKFYNQETWFAVGAPRSANYRGEVLIFQYQGLKEAVRVETSLKGATFGEYFGSSLVAEDVNGDGYDDLIIGAPTFSKKRPDEGRIYVYLGAGKGKFLLESLVVDGQVARGRFGSCVASLKDVDRDGFNDVAVAAPYEDDQRGVLYIYRGFPSGLLSKPAQRISARDLSPHLRGFGISVSAGVDVDGNKFGDVVVGSHLSEDVVLLRSRPVVTLHPDIRTGPASYLLDRRATRFNVSFCSRYEGSSAPPLADVLQSIKIDPFHGRATARGISTFNGLLRLRFGQIHCETYSVDLNVSSKNYLPLQIFLKNELPDCSKKTTSTEKIIFEKEKYDKFSKWCPVGSKAEISKEVIFAGICGTDSVCLSDLRLSCEIPEFLNGTHVLGSSDGFRLLVRLVNRAEPAVEVKLKIWSNLGLIWNEDDSPKAPKLPRRVFWTKTNGLISDTFRGNFSFQIPVKEAFNLQRKADVPEDERELVVGVKIHAANPDLDPSDNECRFVIRLLSDATVMFRTSSSLAKYYGFEKPKGIKELLDVVHYYEVEKMGWSPVLEAELTIRVPHELGGKELIFSDVETSDWMRAFRQPIAEEKNITGGSLDGNIRDVSCSRMDDRCEVFRVVFLQGIPRGPPSWVKVILTLNTTSTASTLGETTKTIVLRTSGVLKYSTVFGGPHRELTDGQSLTIYTEPKVESLEGYVVALSVLSGGFIFLLIVSILKKNRFFKRTKKEELRSLKEAETHFVYLSTKSDVQDTPDST